MFFGVPGHGLGLRLIGRVLGLGFGADRPRAAPRTSPGPRATATDMRRRVRASKDLARKGTGMHTTLRPAAVKRTVFAPNRRMLRMPLNIRTVTRAGLDVSTSVRTHLERRSDPERDLARRHDRRRADADRARARDGGGEVRRGRQVGEAQDRGRRRSRG